jgi:hypothetical protein
MTSASFRLAGPLSLGLTVGLATAADYEGPRTFKASELLAPGQVKGPHFEVAADVPIEGYLYSFTLKTDYGPVEADGRSLLLLRIREVGALAQLDEVSKTGVFVQAAGNSLVKTGKGVVAAVEDPAATMKGMGAGIKRFGTNLGRKAKRAGDQAADSMKSSDKGEKSDDSSKGDKAASAAGGIANSALGVNAGARRWAKKVGADPYTTNLLLKKALIEIGRIDAAGGIAAKIAVPIPPVASSTATVGNLVWGQDPEALMKANEATLRAAGATDAAVKQLYLAKGFTLTTQTLFASSLGAVKAKGCGDYVETAGEAGTEREAFFFAESAEMLQQLHKQTPVSAVLTDSRALVAKLADGRAVALVPVDWIRWTEAFDRAAAEVERRARAELGATKLELRTTAQLSPTAKAELTKRGWTVVEGLPLGRQAAAQPAARK